MKILIYKLNVLVLKLWWGSWWGKAIIHASFDKYKNSVLFIERSMYFGSIKATRMFNRKEFKLFRKKVYRDRRLMFTILFHPVRMKKEFESKSYVLKSYVEI